MRNFFALAPIVFLIHGGGYVFAGDSATHDPATQVVANQVAQFQRHGITAVAVPYQAQNPGRATDQVVRFVKRRAGKRPAYAMGFSAGGGLALSLANRGLVRAAAVLSPLSDCVSWQNGDWPRAQRTGASPARHTGARVPTFIEHALDDPVVPYAQSVKYRGTHPWTILQTDTGNGHGQHMVNGRWPTGFRWLLRRIRLTAKG